MSSNQPQPQVQPVRQPQLQLSPQQEQPEVCPAGQLLRSVYGYHEFRGQQADIISHLLAGEDCLVLMPTGGGKSLCYQIPGMLRSGVALVVSPLIALMEDQVQALTELGVQAAFLNSTLSSQEAYDVKRRLLAGKLDLLYAAPERVTKPDFLELMAKTPLSLIAIDEAHCVSQWGHDFRPEYAQLSALQEAFPGVPRIALTATADVPTRGDIKRLLGLEEAKLFLSSFDRPNINYRIGVKNNAFKQLVDFIRTEHPRSSGIVYCLSRKKVEETAARLRAEGFDALPYHAGLDNETRRQHQRLFINEEAVIIVATIAFGMGIDKPNVRFVAHLDLPKSIEAYYQETGRAGRDGLPASAWMVYGLSDVAVLRQMLDRSDSPPERKRVESQKLNALLGYAESTACRRQVLLKYFGEEHPGNCGNCDVCLSPVETWDGTIAAQQALSSVYRTGQRFGANYLTDVLRGRVTPRIEQFGHDRLAVFGVGSELDEKQWGSVFRQLVAAGSLGVDIEGFGGLFLTEQSKAILKGEMPVTFRKDPYPGRRAKTAVKQRARELLSPESSSLFEALRSKRLELAKEHNVPPYVIFHDKTLAEMAEKKPLNLYALSAISGVGSAKLERYGEAFLEVIARCSQGE